MSLSVELSGDGTLIVPQLEGLPIHFSFLEIFSDGKFVASSSRLDAKTANDIINCHTYSPVVAGLSCRPIFKWCPVLDSFQDDVVNGSPVNQFEEIWDKPCGVKMARDPSSVYGMVDRTLNCNKAWRTIDESSWVLAVRDGQYLLAATRLASATI